VSAEPQLHPQFVTDTDGQRTAVILPIQEFDELLEDLADLAVVAERREEATIAHAEVVAGLREHGHLPD